MIDVSKIADLVEKSKFYVKNCRKIVEILQVLLLIDASFGLEMETFEFLNICQVHGMPKVIGVLTHLDLITNPTKVKKTKKTLKHRFWTEVYQVKNEIYVNF